MLLTDRVEINPAVMLGKPVIRGTRIPVELIIRKLGEGATEDDLLDAYPRLTRDDIQAALLYVLVQEQGEQLESTFVVVQPGHIRVSRKPDQES